MQIVCDLTMHVTGSCIQAGGGVESADRAPAGIVDTEPRLFDLIDRRNDMAGRRPTLVKEELVYSVYP